MQGEKIQATIPPTFAPRFNNQIKQGDWFYLQDFMVKKDSRPLINVVHHFCLFFHEQTKFIKSCRKDNEQFYDFLKFEEILQGDLAEIQKRALIGILYFYIRYFPSTYCTNFIICLF